MLVRLIFVPRDSNITSCLTGSLHLNQHSMYQLLTSSVGAKTVTAVEELLTASSSGPPTASMAFTSCLRPAPLATERMVVALGARWAAIGTDALRRSKSSPRSEEDTEVRMRCEEYIYGV